MDNFDKTSMYLVPDWITRINEDYEIEVEMTTSWSLKLLAEGGRRVIWNLCKVLGVDTDGVPGQSCRLFERYIFHHMHNVLHPGPLDVEQWESFKRMLVPRIPLLMASCIQLAAKMSSVGMQVNATLVRTCLLSKGIVFSVEDIKRSEYQVFSTLEYRVPLWTSLEMAQMLAIEVGLPKSALEGVALVVNIAEFRRDRLTASVRNISRNSVLTNFNANSLSTLHLSAGGVAATVRYLECHTTDCTSRLAQLTRAPLSYIRCVCDVILADVLIDDIGVSQKDIHSRKRKRSH